MIESRRKLSNGFLLRDSRPVEPCDVRLRNEDFSESSLCCRFPKLPPSKGKTYFVRTNWWRQLEAVHGALVMVIQYMDDHAGRGAFVGEVHSNILKGLGCVGVVTDGTVKDLAAIEELGFQLFSERVSFSHAYVHVLEFGTPVQRSGVRVRPGDLLQGDQSSLARLPREIAKDIPDMADDLRERKKQIIARSRSTEFYVAGLGFIFEEGERG